MSKSRSKWQIWAAPLTIGVVTLVGLVAALLADGFGNVVSWISLGVPVLICAKALWRPAQKNGRAAEARPGKPIATRLDPHDAG